MEILIKKAFDPVFAESLIKKNMKEYYLKRNITWDHVWFLNSWNEFDNFEIYVDNIRSGVIRLTYNDSATFLRDLQIEPKFQRKGIGSRCLKQVIEEATKNKYEKLALRVFSENPAIKLYEKVGFQKTSEIEGLIEMEISLGIST